MDSKIQVLIFSKASIKMAVLRKVMKSAFSVGLESVMSIEASFTIMG